MTAPSIAAALARVEDLCEKAAPGSGADISVAAVVAESLRLLPILAAEVSRQAEEIERLRDTLQAAAGKFREYEAGHAAKCSVDGAQKAAANAWMAKLCEGALKSGKEGA